MRRQSRAMSLVEAVTNVAVGYAIAVTTQILVFPLFGFAATYRDHLLIGATFTVISIARAFALRRLFEAIRVRDGIRAGYRRPARDGGVWKL